jgi:NifU-like protein involved in Fe-S cluster formation
MAALSEIYNSRIIELAAAIPRAERLASPDATATAHSKLCGSTIVVDIAIKDGRVAAFGQQVKACLLGQAAASVMGREIVGSMPQELRDVAERMRRMLKENGAPPEGRWADLAVMQPVKDHKARHASTLLVFEAVERALSEIDARSGRKVAGAAAV